MRARWSAGSGLALLLLAAGCPATTATTEETCRDSSQCDEGWLCVDGACARACNRNLDCPRRDQVCREGTCAQVPDPDCDEDADCRGPNPCQLPDGAACRAGACVYASQLAGEDCDDEDPCTEGDACDGQGRCLGTPRVCASRPPPACVEDDSLYRSYAERGVCLPASGECVYAPYDVPCPRCAVACLAPCAALTCDDTQGGCRRDGRCLPGATPGCVYTLADDDTSCALASDPAGSPSGHCVGGVCSGCRDDADCTRPPGDDAQCFSADCQPGGCVYTPRPGERCREAFCRQGYLYPLPLCNNDGVCIDGNRQSCGGLRCNTEGTACLDRCTGDGDCLPGAYCDVGSGRCEGLLEDGADCASGGAAQCLSGYCDGHLCCAGGDCCQAGTDCPASYTAPARCLDLTAATRCQGQGLQVACVEHTCQSLVIDDDSACAGLLHACPDNLAPVACSADADQAAPVCPVDCASGGACATGYQCEGGQCVRIPGVGDACTGTGQGSCPANLKCENGVCCAAAGPSCCTATSACAGGLTCDLSVASCRVSCVDFTTTACADPAGTVCAGNACVPKFERGASCQVPAQCLSGFCVGSRCCDRACDQTCESCLATQTGGVDGTCGLRQAGQVCRAAAGVCDLVETCSGTSASCPADAKSTATCRPASGDCDLADACDGVGDGCPTLDRVRQANEVCRAASGPCDVEDRCDGATKTCADNVVAAGTPCRDQAGDCDRQDFCDGARKDCVDGVEPATVTCRPSQHPQCDPPEQCSGGKTCPADDTAAWHADCGTCAWCEGAQCVGNSTEHRECGFCQQCQAGTCVGATPGTDPRGDDCPAYDCASTVAGWTTASGQGRCTAFTSAVATTNGTCSGPGACHDLSASCTGSTVIATCNSWACARKAGNSTPEVVACQPGSARASNDSPDEVCWTGNVTTAECHDEGSAGDTYYWWCETGGTCVNYYYSCPMLFSWSGQGFRFESDLYTSGFLALIQGYGFRKPDPNDYYVLRHPVVPRNGAIELQLTEERYEIDYLDQARLFAVDLPADRQALALPNNVPLPWAPLQDRLATVSAAPQVPVAMVHVNTGLDVTPELQAADGVFLQLSEDRNRSSWNTIEIDLGDLAGASIIKLIVDGKSNWPTTPDGLSHLIALDPTGLKTRLEVLDSGGHWVEVPRDQVTLIRPKEFSRPMAIDITSVFLTDQHRLRLSWAAKTYLDAVLFDTTPPIALTVAETALIDADLHFRGFSARTSMTDNFEYDYDQLVPKPPRYGPGGYTRFGEVGPLLDAVDDMFVIFGAGEELTLRWEDLPPPAPGHTRQWVLYTSGYYKRFGSVYAPYAVAPLPFAAMSNFPYDETVERYPDDAAHRDYLSTWNTRVEVP